MVVVVFQRMFAAANPVGITIMAGLGVLGPDRSDEGFGFGFTLDFLAMADEAGALDCQFGVG